MATNEKEIYTPIEAVGEYCKIVSEQTPVYYPNPRTVLIYLLNESAKRRLGEKLNGSCDFDVLLSKLSENDIDWGRFEESSKFTMKPLKVEPGKWIRRHNIELKHITEEEGRKAFELISDELGITVELDSISHAKDNFKLTSKPVDLNTLGAFQHIMTELVIELYTSARPIDRDNPKQGFSCDWLYKHAGGGSNGYELWSKNGRVCVELDLVTRKWTLTANRR